MFLISSSVKFNELSFAIISIPSSYRRSAHDKVVKHVGIPRFFTISKTSNKTFFHYVSIPLIEDIKLQTLSCEMKCCTVALKLLLKIPTFRLFDVIALMTMLIW